MRDNTPKKHGGGYKAQWLAPFFQSRLWQGSGRVRRTGCVPMSWHRSITFPIDKSDKKVGCNAVRLVNAFSPTGPVARYLGPHLDIMGSIQPEPERRRAAASRTWTRFRPVWFRAGVPLRVRRLFFQALVVSILFSGLEALRLRPPDYEYLDRFVLGLGRRMMRGKATISTKLEDGTEKKRIVDRRKVWDFIGLVPSATLVRAQPPESEGFRGAQFLDVRGSQQPLISSHLRERDKMLLRAVLCGGVRNGFFWRKAQGDDIRCRSFGDQDGDVYLFCDCTVPFSILFMFVGSSEMVPLLVRDRSNWLRCLL